MDGDPEYRQSSRQAKAGRVLRTMRTVENNDYLQRPHNWHAHFYSVLARFLARYLGLRTYSTVQYRLQIPHCLILALYRAKRQASLILGAFRINARL